MGKYAERVLEDFLNEWSSDTQIPDSDIDNSFDDYVIITGHFTREDLLRYMQTALEFNAGDTAVR